MQISTEAKVVRTSNRAAVRWAWLVGFTLLTGVAAWVRIPLPFTPVPITLQTLVVLACGIVLGRDGIYSQLLYLVLGGIGLPLFAGGATGLALFGPTGGYLFGFVAAAALAQHWVRPVWAESRYVARVGRLFLVSLVIFIPGVLQLKLFTGVSFEQAIWLGFVPFLGGDLLKVGLVAALPSRFLRLA